MNQCAKAKEKAKELIEKAKTELSFIDLIISLALSVNIISLTILLISFIKYILEEVLSD
jgi:hypothetical protein